MSVALHPPKAIVNPLKAFSPPPTLPAHTQPPRLNALYRIEIRTPDIDGYLLPLLWSVGSQTRLSSPPLLSPSLLYHQVSSISRHCSGLVVFSRPTWFSSSVFLFLFVHVRYRSRSIERPRITSCYSISSFLFSCPLLFAIVIRTRQHFPRVVLPSRFMGPCVLEKRKLS